MFDLMIIGQISLDHNIDFDGREVFMHGGAVTYSGFAAAALGHRVAVVPKGDGKRDNPLATFADSKVEKIFPIFSATCTVMENTYFTPDRERRRCLCKEMIAPYVAADIPHESARIYHLAGLVNGDISSELIRETAGLGDTAVDVQALLRCRNEDGSLELRDWPEKKEYLPLIRYLKCDAAEAEVLTGTSDRDNHAQHRGHRLRWQDHLPLAAEAKKPVRTNGAGRHHVCNLPDGTTELRHPRRAGVRCRRSFSEDGGARSV